MEYVTLVNRSSKTLIGTWDGRRHELKPGKHSFPEIQAVKFKDQNPVMGSEDPYTLEKLYLLGIEEHGDDCSPIEQSDAIERFDRKKVGGPPVEVIAGNGLYRPATDSSRPLISGGPVDSSFEKP